MKRIIWWTGLAVLLITTLGQAEEKTVYVNVPTVNVRAKAGTQHKVVKVISTGHSLRVLAEQGDWYQVELEDETVGWVHKTMLTNDMPDITKIAQLESELKTQAAEFEQTKNKLQLQTGLNSKLKLQLEETQLEIDKLARQNQELKKHDRLKLAGIGIGVLLLGWGVGFFTGFFKRQAEDKRFIKMMVEANSLPK